MSARFWIICAGALSANIVHAEAPRAELFLGDTTPSDTLIWQPSLNGLMRYQLQLPESGIKDAQKYKDTSALFYLSQKNDLGLQLVEEQEGHLNFTLTPDEAKAIYTQPLTPALSYHLGLTVDAERNKAQLGASWRTVTGHTQLDEITATLEESDVSLSWARSELSNDEHSERLYSISSNSGNLQARFGARWFDLFQGTDVLSEVGVDRDALVIGAQLERGLGSANGFIGAMSNLSNGNVDLTLGVRYALGQSAVIDATTNTGLVSQNIQSLKYLRSAALPSHWRNYVHLGARGQQDNAPIFPTLSCLLGCYENHPDQSQHEAKNNIALKRAYYRHSFDELSLPGNEKMGFVGGGLLYELRPNFFVGPEAFGAASGNRGGFITLGMSADRAFPINEDISVVTGLHIGAGGGRGGLQLSGGGLMYRGNAGLSIKTGYNGHIGLGVSRYKFPNGYIDSTQPYISYRHGFNALHGRGWADPSEVKHGEVSNLKEREFSTVIRTYAVSGHVRRDNGAPQHKSLGLLGVEFANYVRRDSFVKLEAHGAMQGQSNGYMQILAGGGQRFRLSDRVELKLGIAAGVAGGGGVATGGGVIFDAQAGIKVNLSEKLFTELALGKVKASDGEFESDTVSLKVGYRFGNPVIVPNDELAEAAQGFEQSNFRFRFSNQTYLNSDTNWRNHSQNVNIDNLGVQLDYFLNNTAYLSGQGFAAYQGKAGAYMSGLVGMGFHIPITETLYIDFEGLSGAAGGGGTNVGNGFVTQFNAQLGVNFNERDSIALGLGRIVATDGDFRANVVSLSYIHKFSLFTRSVN